MARRARGDPVSHTTEEVFEPPLPASTPPKARPGRRRRRPSGEPPPLPRELSTSGRYWLGAAGLVLLLWIVLFSIRNAGQAITRVDLDVLELIARVRNDL